jgi:hypothetical protein
MLIVLFLYKIVCIKYTMYQLPDQLLCLIDDFIETENLF